MSVRRIATVLFLPLMLAFGSGVYLYLGTLKSKAVKERVQLPTVTKPSFTLPGTMFLAQGGRLFKLKNGSFTEIGPPGDWSMPTLTPDHTRLIAVLTGKQSSDLYLLDLDGHIIKRLTHDDARIIDANHWAFYPRVTPDGSSVMYSYDSPKSGFRVDFAIWSMPLNGIQSQARRRTDPYSRMVGRFGWKKLRAFNWSLRRNSHAVPWKLFDPDLDVTDTWLPALFPYWLSKLCV